jgi:hypothetical protein
LAQDVVSSRLPTIDKAIGTLFFGIVYFYSNLKLPLFRHGALSLAQLNRFNEELYTSKKPGFRRKGDLQCW